MLAPVSGSAASVRPSAGAAPRAARHFEAGPRHRRHSRPARAWSSAGAAQGGAGWYGAGRRAPGAAQALLRVGRVGAIRPRHHPTATDAGSSGRPAPANGSAASVRQAAGAAPRVARHFEAGPRSAARLEQHRRCSGSGRLVRPGRDITQPQRTQGPVSESAASVRPAAGAVSRAARHFEAGPRHRRHSRPARAWSSTGAAQGGAGWCGPGATSPNRNGRRVRWPAGAGERISSERRAGSWSSAEGGTALRGRPSAGARLEQHGRAAQGRAGWCGFACGIDAGSSARGSPRNSASPGSPAGAEVCGVLRGRPSASASTNRGGCLERVTQRRPVGFDARQHARFGQFIQRIVGSAVKVAMQPGKA